MARRVGAQRGTVVCMLLVEAQTNSEGVLIVALVEVRLWASWSVQQAAAIAAAAVVVVVLVGVVVVVGFVVDGQWQAIVVEEWRT